ncbi:hypothetical protein [Streptomyces sp. B1I3]|uniref:hypothetical protein n=1 Tax=Streptomyces sp. B1I3 TaxID=3042264 RepID=UPI00278A1373|nr:hypothetical protein [Streptomyces sp. B1I3]MDQ0795456.1 hypothetical protein [Streptomyces sp. B1I3]
MAWFSAGNVVAARSPPRRACRPPWAWSGTNAVHRAANTSPTASAVRELAAAGAEA